MKETPCMDHVYGILTQSNLQELKLNQHQFLQKNKRDLLRQCIKSMLIQIMVTCSLEHASTFATVTIKFRCHYGVHVRNI